MTITHYNNESDFISYGCIDICPRRFTDPLDNIIHYVYYIDFILSNRDLIATEDQQRRSQYLNAFQLSIRNEKDKLITDARSQRSCKWLEELINHLEQSILDFQMGVCRRPIGKYHRDQYKFLEQFIIDCLERIVSAKSRWIRAIETVFLLETLNKNTKQFFHARCPIRMLYLLRSILKDVDEFKATLVNKVRTDTEKQIVKNLDQIFQYVVLNIQLEFTEYTRPTKF